MDETTAPRSGDLPRDRSRIGGYVRALRPRQWLKNVLVFAVPVAAGDALHAGTMGHASLAFVAFCMAASGTYLVNDARDVSADRQHPTKRTRPIAAGLVPVSGAYALAAVLVAASLVVAFATRRDLGITVLAYLAVTTSYSVWLKRVPILDIVAVAGCYVLRAVAGATATGLPISEWFFIVTSFGALMIVVGKRESELDALGERAGDVRPTLGVYTRDFLRYLRGVATAVVLVAYCLWAFDSAAHSDSGTIWFQVSVVPFATAIFQYGLILERGGGEHPEVVLTTDRAILVSGAVWAVIYAYAIYRT
ncbi:MAG TPA: decaprenyl-phosphate phosphoribosyltransferase [Acidimicrobiales bacterium]|nr:decaprenyl-phosphate phosphoribosyltransferase [Acidimicrobiales bacterium]